MTLRDVHGSADPKVDGVHARCPDLFCCACECRTCKRLWFAADRPRSKDCPAHGQDVEGVRGDLVASRARVAVLEAALAPFAEYARGLPAVHEGVCRFTDVGPALSSSCEGRDYVLTFAHLRAALHALSEPGRS